MPPVGRFAMVLGNSSNYNAALYNNLAANISVAPRKNLQAKNNALNAPMINRVYNAKPGCSSCGKKVA
jgi:hypothetical protein